MRWPCWPARCSRQQETDNMQREFLRSAAHSDASSHRPSNGLKLVAACAAVAVAAAAGLWAGQTGLIKLPIATKETAPEQAHNTTPLVRAAETASKIEEPHQRRIIHYRNPMGLPDVSPVPKKDSMGMDYIPVYEGESGDGDTIKVSPGRIQR